MNPSSHTFHIPVMGTGFTIDTPIKVARYGISSVVSVVDDFLIEKIRKFHTERVGEEFHPISPGEEDSRAKRITAYLNLVHRLVRKQVEEIRGQDFTEGSEIEKYFELLPDGPVRHLYEEMTMSGNPSRKEQLREELRSLVQPGSIDVNIMTKIDGLRANRQGETPPPEFSDAKSALRGFAKSDVEGAVVFSAGMNQGLYAYAAEFEDFFPTICGLLKKRIILKVSDYRSALIQGKFLAKKGLWVSEYRIESGLNCGGHAFATKGMVAGPILEEFRENRAQLVDQLHPIFNRALEALGKAPQGIPLPVRVTYQGGIGTADEDRLLREFYSVDGTGWGTPFLLVPEVCNVDDDHLKRLCESNEEEVQLSRCSPLGVPFWTLRTSGSENLRRDRIEAGTPGSPCPRRFLVSSAEFSEELLCLGAQSYQEKKVEVLEENTEISEATRTAMIQETLEKACLCRDLAGGALIRNGIDLKATPAICCGPNIVHFSQVFSLREMIDQIYGRAERKVAKDRPHFFLKEIQLYVNHMRDELRRQSLGLIEYPSGHFAEYVANLHSAIDYYRENAERLATGAYDGFVERLHSLEENLREMGKDLSLDSTAILETAFSH
ncbi:MAG: hypothetical protein KC917_02405 [Candidatus Omnitrophica bacterium]|nr:hypothetical protein [Candidatus Omnitrophota bacterium]MCA9436201.1 hypothetical protein [Candidatus Omnitrophota bacterium]